MSEKHFYMKIDHAPDHAGYDVFVNRKLVGRIPWTLMEGDARYFLDKYAELPSGELLKCRVFPLVEAPE